MSLAKVKSLGVTTPQGYAGTLVHEFTLTNSVRRFPPFRFSDVESRDLVRLTTEDSNRPFADFHHSVMRTFNPVRFSIQAKGISICSSIFYLPDGVRLVGGNERMEYWKNFYGLVTRTTVGDLASTSHKRCCGFASFKFNVIKLTADGPTSGVFTTS
jgi:hypothetical protein